MVGIVINNVFVWKKTTKSRKKSDKNLQKQRFPAYFRHFRPKRNFLKNRTRPCFEHSLYASLCKKSGKTNKHSKTKWLLVRTWMHMWLGLLYFLVDLNVFRARYKGFMVRLDLKKCWFAVTRPTLLENLPTQKNLLLFQRRNFFFKNFKPSTGLQIRGSHRSMSDWKSCLTITQNHFSRSWCPIEDIGNTVLRYTFYVNIFSSFSITFFSSSLFITF